jgi:lysophospholipase L1-like esterase
MRTILCYGDSNTWGDPPGGVGRYEWTVRWPGVLQQRLGPDYRVVEEGLCGRTTCFDDPLSPNRNGLTYLPVALETHYPIDMLVIMLGTNDVKARYNHSAFTIAQGAGELLVAAKKLEPKIRNILLVAPPHVVKSDNVESSFVFDGAESKSQELAQHFKYFADMNGCHFFDAASVARSSPIDGIHIDAENHQVLAEALSKKVRNVFEGGN